MKRFTDAGRQALGAKNWYAALSMALIIPEICGSLESPGTGKSKQRYENWARQWLQPVYTNKARTPNEVDHVLFSAEDIYQARCSIIHTGNPEIDEKRKNSLDRFEFFSAGSHLNVCAPTVDGKPAPRYLQINVEKFCCEVFEAADQWRESVLSNEAVQSEINKLLVIHEPGTVLHGIQFS